MVHWDSHLLEMREQPDRLISLHWDEQVERTYPGLRIQVENRRGMIAVLATRLAQSVSISSASQHRTKMWSSLSSIWSFR